MNVINRTADALKGHWCKEPRDGQGNMCIAVRLGSVSGHVDHQYRNAAEIIRDVVVEQYPDRLETIYGFTPIVLFNDHDDTTEDEVLAVLDKAAVRYDEVYG
jgi:hypothetical protein